MRVVIVYCGWINSVMSCAGWLMVQELPPVSMHRFTLTLSLAIIPHPQPSTICAWTGTKQRQILPLSLNFCHSIVRWNVCFWMPFRAEGKLDPPVLSLSGYYCIDSMSLRTCVKAWSNYLMECSLETLALEEKRSRMFGRQLPTRHRGTIPSPPPPPPPTRPQSSNYFLRFHT